MKTTDRRPHVLHLGPNVPGGMRTALRGLLASPLADGYRLDVVATHRGPGAVRRLAIYLLAVLRLTAWSLRGKGRIVHIHSTVRGSMYRKAALVLIAKGLRRRVVLHIHSGPGDVVSFRAGMSRGRAAALGLSLRCADVSISVSAASAAELERCFGLTEIEVVHNAAPAMAAEAAAALPDGCLAVFLGGFANPVKGGEVMLDALAQVEPGEFRFALAGPGELPERGRALLEQRPDVEWLGWLDGEERRRVLGAAPVFVLASTSEGLPMALLEAMARGQAIVATEVGGVPDVVDQETEALLVPPGEPAALARAISRLVEDAELRRRLGEAARRRAGEMGEDRVATKIAAIYARLLEG